MTRKCAGHLAPVLIGLGLAGGMRDRTVIAETVTIGPAQDNYVSYHDGAWAPTNVMDNGGTGPTLYVYGQNNGATWCSKPWIRFDLANRSYQAETSATIVVTASVKPAWGYEGQPWGRQLCLWALKTGFVPAPNVLGTDWTERNITWNNAPGNHLSMGRLCDPATTTPIGYLYHATNPAVGDRFAFTIPRLGDFIQADQSVTVMLTTTGDGANGGFASKEHPNQDWQPMLTFSLGPPMGTFMEVTRYRAGSK